MHKQTQTSPDRATEKPYAYISLKTQFENLGDALINRELIKLVSSRAHTTVDLTRSPESFHRATGLAAIPSVRTLSGLRMRFFFEMIGHRLSGRSCYFFLNPGGLGGGVGESLTVFLKSHIYNIALIFLKIIGVRICQVGVSYEPMGWMEASVARVRSKACYAFVVRDQESFDYIRALGIRTSEIVPDLSFNLYETQQEVREDASARFFAAVFSFRSDKGFDHDTLAEFAARVIDNHPPDAHFLFASQVARDSELMSSVAQLLAPRFGAHRLHFAEFYDDMDSAFDYYGRSAVVYSNRLHVLLMAAYMNAVPMAIVNVARQRKIAALFEDMKISQNLQAFPPATLRVGKGLDRQSFVEQSRKLSSYFDRLLNV